MSVTNTLKSRTAYVEAGFTDKQADAMANLDEQHANDTADHISRVFAADFTKLEGSFSARLAEVQGNLKAEIQASRTDFHSTVRLQTWAIMAFVVAACSIAVTLATLLRR